MEINLSSFVEGAARAALGVDGRLLNGPAVKAWLSDGERTEEKRRIRILAQRVVVRKRHEELQRWRYLPWVAVQRWLLRRWEWRLWDAFNERR